jgi:hypothetical protein
MNRRVDTLFLGTLSDQFFSELRNVSLQLLCWILIFNSEKDMPADGVFCYILKRLSDAERNNDKIYGIIRGVHVSAAGPGEGTFCECASASVCACVCACVCAFMCACVCACVNACMWHLSKNKS